MQPTALRAQSRGQSDPAALQSLGQLIFTDTPESHAGAFQLTIVGLAAPPANHHYELWLHSAQTATLSLGKITITEGKGSVQGSTTQNLLIYDQASISLEADSDDDPEISNQIVLSATRPEALQSVLAQLLITSTLGDAASTKSGFIATALQQVQIAVQHTGFLRNALSKTDLPQARRHSEHITNILDGKEGFMYSDLDRDGRLENPGDGFGVRSYLDSAHTGALDLLALTESLTEDSEQGATAEQIVTVIEEGQTFVASSFDDVLQIFASDTVTEAGEHAQDLTALIDTLSQRINTAYTLTLPLASYTFYGVASEATPTPTSTATLTRTPSPSPTRTATATATPRPATPTPRQTPPPTLPATSTRTLVAPIPALTTTVPITSASVAAPTTTNGTLLVPVQQTLQLSLSVGQSWRNPADGSLYIYVAGGEFLMGSTASEAISPREEPQHSVSVSEFWLQQTETANHQYARCVSAGVCTVPQNERWNNPAYANHPVTDVTWQQANAYAAWVGGRLPTEAEWEKACRNGDTRIFPWGEEPPTNKLSNFGAEATDTMPVGSYPAGATPLGVVDLSGNVWEWVSSLDADYPYAATDGREEAEAEGKRIVRGGSYYYTQYQIRCTARSGFAPATASPHMGFRVVIEQPIAEWRHMLDEALYVYVPGGEFNMGSTATTAVSPREEPQHRVSMDEFWLQQTETTNRQYARCVNEGICTAPDNTRWDDPAYADHPVIDVTWQQANTYAAWVGGRLPTEAEWEKACRSGDARTFPWGEEAPTETLSNFGADATDTVPVGSFPAGASPFGALDLSGNVWEWVSSLDADYPYVADDGREDAEDPGKRIVRGGSYYYTQYQIRCASRTGFVPETASQHIGFRVALDAPQ